MTREGGETGALEAKRTTRSGALPARGSGFSPARIVYAGLGLVFLGLAFLGAFLPVLPTTPFVLVAASLLARSSPRVHRRILESRLFGPTVRRWQETGSISRPAKVLAITMLWTTIAISVGFAVEGLWLRLLLIAIAGAVTGFILSRPSLDS